MKTYKTIHEAYLGSLEDVYFDAEYNSSPRGFPCREKTDYTFRVLEPVNEPIVTKDLERNEVIADYTRKETELYDSCSDRVEDFAKASKFWEKLANPDGTVNSAYGNLIWKNKSHGNPNFELNPHARYLDAPSHIDAINECNRTPWEWAKQSLIADKDTRQAILRFSLPQHAWKGVRDFVCTMHGNFMIRDNKLNLAIIMRSNDLWLGLTYDLPWFISLIDRMVEELKPYYPELTKGHYTHTSHSMHLYERDEAKILKALGLNDGNFIRRR